MTPNVSYIKTATGLSLFIDGKPYVVNMDHCNYDKICAAVKTQSYKNIPDLINISNYIGKYVKIFDKQGININVDNGTIDYKGIEIHHTLVNRIHNMIREGFDITYLINFMYNLFQNPSEKAIDELYTFLEYGKMPITPDGYFIAYKRVNSNYKSIHDNKTDNSVGKEVSMPRDAVDSDSNNTCSYGLHICSFDYLSQYAGDKVIVVKVNPADVVSIPTDYANTKARVCKYLVIGELTLQEAGLPSNILSNSSVYMEDEEQQELFEKDNSNSSNTVENTSSTPSVDITQSDWYQYGYSVGYEDGKNKESDLPDAVISDFHDHVVHLGYTVDQLKNPITNDDVIAYNTAYNVGYKHGRSHKKRLFKINDAPFVFIK